MQHSFDRRRFLFHCGLLGGGAALGYLAPRWANSPLEPPADARPPEDGPEARLRRLKIVLPVVARPKATLEPAVRVGETLYVSGHGPGSRDGRPIVGKLGADMNVRQGQEAARLVGLQVLSVVRAELGSLDRVVRLVKVLGMVNCTADFTAQPQVINGFSDLMVEVFGERAGKGARSAVGMVSLPGGIPVEVEAIFHVRS
jgi:enamine deaminase RidA (YjgF/YER057c/UK114 family)